MEDRTRLRELRFQIRKLWYPPRENEIKEWRRKVGINSSTGISEFAKISRKDKNLFFENAREFIEEIEKQSIYYYREISKNIYIPEENIFGILNVSPDANIDTIKKHYRHLVLKHHPDKGGKPEDFIKITEAYRKILSLKNTIK
ncbi:hypothetical protein DRQ09_05310 [candidate division KSB1 bacterium]|nr:MAG: hypothetical protein DRQ09_05310 [candidate division KSB1 bacterium]